MPLQSVIHTINAILTNWNGSHVKQPGSLPAIIAGNQGLSLISCSLSWPTLETRRKAARLILLYKILHGESAVTIPEYVWQPALLTRQYHPNRFARLSTSTDAYKFSFLPRTIIEWNMLPADVILSPSTEIFRVGVWDQLVVSWCKFLKSVFYPFFLTF